MLKSYVRVFTHTALVALAFAVTAAAQNGSTAEMGLVGNDGAVGIACFLEETRRLIGLLCRSRATRSECAQ